MKIFIKTKPSAKQEKIEKIGEKSFEVFVKAPAKNGKANEAVIRILAKHFSVTKSSIKIIAGATARQKIVEIKTF
jgi:uncharacterized protein (TIGR00251 family)